MTDTIIMEELSKSFLETIANRQGYFNATSRDYGTDLTIRKANLCPIRRRYLTGGKAIDIQIKAVFQKYVRNYDDPSKTSIKYDLEVKNYNDLIIRANENGAVIPLILAVFIMPDDPDDWLTIDTEQLIIKKCAYYYQVDPSADHSTNQNTIAIEIPKANKIDTDFYTNIFNSLD
ncbi:DUF4365 domain-containing protein [Chryseobacterium sp. G0162]|uniref:DUF4365 domain-containing protein n=1 Tax=Chryseobacterium sp. G0162 TaxID=2487063 RepID=UPI000F515655|nr:DUF4365 domain-containing protein [Chryseobacterium sp. G0162]AZB10943.1 DUF4365 domain-containing protein [Chryseobacterium sp. G0162]